MTDYLELLILGHALYILLHGAFGTGIQSTGWNLGKLMKAMFKILDESPALYQKYILKQEPRISFMQSLSQTRWVKDEPVADRALDFWPSIVALVRDFEGLCQSKRPRNNKSSDTLEVHTHRSASSGKVYHFFGSSASILQPYLVMFQTDAPMVPFMSD